MSAEFVSKSNRSPRRAPGGSSNLLHFRSSLTNQQPTKHSTPPNKQDTNQSHDARPSQGTQRKRVAQYTGAPVAIMSAEFISKSTRSAVVEGARGCCGRLPHQSTVAGTSAEFVSKSNRTPRRAPGGSSNLLHFRSSLTNQQPTKHSTPPNKQDTNQSHDARPSQGTQQERVAPYTGAPVAIMLAKFTTSPPSPPGRPAVLAVVEGARGRCGRLPHKSQLLAYTVHRGSHVGRVRLQVQQVAQTCSMGLIQPLAFQILIHQSPTKQTLHTTQQARHQPESRCKP